MGSAKVPNGIVWFGYDASPYALRVKSYLALRNIAYAECPLPELLPRPALNALGINYRRVPVLSIGRDVYLDSRAIVARLETLFPPSDTHPPLSTPQTAGLARIFQRLVIDTAGIFGNAALFITGEFDLIKRNPGFAKDRKGLFGPGWTLADMAGQEREAIVGMRETFAMVEEVLGDGREWIARTAGVGIADFELVWPLDWMLSALGPPKEYFNAEEYPKAFAWIGRYREALNKAAERAPKPVLLDESEAVQFVTTSQFSDSSLSIDANDPSGLQEGLDVELFPIDSGGFTHQDRGRLVKLTRDEVAIAVQSKNGQDVRIHAPRRGFRIKPLHAEKS